MYKADNKVTTLVASLLIQVAISTGQFVPPTITNGPPATPLYFDSNAQLYCQAQGYGTLRYDWFLNDAPLDFNQYKATFDSYTGLLTVPYPFPEGYYQCQVSSPLFGKAISNVTKVAMLKMTSTVQDTTDHTFNVNVNDPLELPCDVSNTEIVPGAEVSWQLVSNRTTATFRYVSTNQRIQIDEKWSLRISSADMADMQGGDYYRCFLTNSITNARTLAVAYTKVVVSAAVGPPPSAIKPYYVSSPPVIGFLGKTASFKCFFSGGKAISISWKKADNSPLDYRFVTGGLDQSGKLSISEVQQSDEGSYICNGVQNGLLSGSATVQFSVKSAPFFQTEADSPHDTNATVGKNVTINCNAFAIPAAKITWYKNGDLLDVNNLNKKMTISPDLRTLTISQLCKNCSGDTGQTDLSVIQCNASNDYGYVLGQGYVNVLDPTQITVPPKNAILDSPNPINFTCQAVTDVATTVTYTWTLDGSPVYDGQVNMSVPGQVYIDISGSSDGGSKFLGTWTCNASNGVSFATASAELATSHTGLATASAWYWWIPVAIIIIILLVLLLIFFVFYNRGDEYGVDKYERRNGNDPVRDLADTGFQDYKRPLVSDQNNY